MKVFLDTVGCRLNQSEIETYARQLTAAGHRLVATMQEADLMVLNTCTVTAAAASDSRQKIRQANKAGISEIVVTGCLSTIKPEKIARMPGVIKVVPNEEKENLVAGLLQIPLSELERDEILRQPVPGARLRTRAFIKVQDGCDNKCTFCITTIARGPGKSRTVEDILREVQGAIDSGVKEVVLTGVHLGSWGYDLSEPRHLQDLVAALLEKTNLPRLRLSSLEPWDLDEDFFALWQNPRLCRHLHLPLQSGSAGVLRRMARKTTPGDFAALVESARRQIPDVAITTDLIAGFPGETRQEFEEGLKFVDSMEFAGAHVFTYSARPGTAAARMPNQVHNYTRKERSAALREATTTSAQRYQRAFIGSELDVLWESAHFDSQAERWHLIGLTDNYLRVQAAANRSLWNEITLSRMIALKESPACLSGEITQYPDTI